MSIIPEFINSIDKIKILHKKKGDDYAIDDNPFSNFDIQEYVISLFKSDRDKAFANHYATKLARLSTLLSSNKEPSNESIEDTFDDFASYILLHKADWMRRKERKRYSQVQIDLQNKV